MNEKSVFSFTVDRDGERLDVFLTDALQQTDEVFTRSFVRRRIDEGRVQVNGKTVKAGHRLRVGEKVTLPLPEPKVLEAEAQDIPIDIVYEDTDLAVINKAQGMVVHPAPGHESDTLVNALMYHVQDLAGIGGVLRPGIVHRIDKDTSGLLCIAKNDAAHQHLSAQIKAKTAQRVYVAIVSGNIEKRIEREGDGGWLRIETRIGRSSHDRKKMAVVHNVRTGREAVTYVRLLERYERFCLVQCRLETGRTHQIRVHLAYIGHPVAGDPLYGGKKNDLALPGQALHAAEMNVTHPKTGEELHFRVPPPQIFLNCVGKLRKMQGLPSKDERLGW